MHADVAAYSPAKGRPKATAGPGNRALFDLALRGRDQGPEVEVGTPESVV